MLVEGLHFLRVGRGVPGFFAVFLFLELPLIHDLGRERTDEGEVGEGGHKGGGDGDEGGVAVGGVKEAGDAAGDAEGVLAGGVGDC